MTESSGGVGSPPTTEPHLPPWQVRRFGLVLGPAVAVAVWVASAADGSTAALSVPGRACAGVGAWMAVWWLTQAVPLAVTALLPVVAFPLLGIGSLAATTAPYSRPLLFLFLGGFLIGLAIERSGLHLRVALAVLAATGTAPRRLIAAMMAVSAALSMWISNTATVVMLLPVALSVLTALSDPADRDTGDLAPAMLLGVAYAASVGGIATLIGTPPNLVLATFAAEQLDMRIGMLQWLGIGGPMAVVLLPLIYVYLTRFAFRLPESTPVERVDLLRSRRAELGPMTREEWVVGTVFGLTVLGWLTRGWLTTLPGLADLDDAGIAMLGAIVLFAIPTAAQGRRFALDWATARRVPWEILILFGGGLTLAAALSRHGVDAWIATPLAGLAGAPLLLVLLMVATLVIFATEITSNTAVASALLPVLAASATSIGVAVAPVLIVATVAASCAFMLPVATPPNAVVFASGQVAVGTMARAGVVLNVLCAAVIAVSIAAADAMGWLPALLSTR